MSRDIEVWEGEGGAARGLPGEFDRVAASSRSIVGKHSNGKRTSTEAIIAILDDRCIEVMRVVRVGG
jgi:hypothetical protein